MKTKNKIAKMIRFIFIPPIVYTFFALVIYFQTNIFAKISETFLSILFIGIIPVLAYPICFFIEKDQEKRRIKSRKLSFILSIVGYLLGFIYALVFHVNTDQLIIYSVYFVSVIILSIFNIIIKVKASGHATSMTGPIYGLIYFKVYPFLALFIISYVFVFASSLYLKRHTIKEFLIGTFIPLFALIISVLIIV